VIIVTYAGTTERGTFTPPAPGVISPTGGWVRHQIPSPRTWVV
jgi:hypothetical protein